MCCIKTMEKYYYFITVHKHFYIPKLNYINTFIYLHVYIHNDKTKTLLFYRQISVSIQYFSVRFTFELESEFLGF